MGLFPFRDLSEFEQFRSLAFQDAAAAMLRAQLRRSPSTRSVVRIYFGPPGTGKTLNAVRQAVELVDPAFPGLDDFEQCFARFNELAGRVAFLTFHQSLQYEDVVEAIRPFLSGAEEAASESDESSELASSGDEELDGASAPESEESKDSGLRYTLHAGPVMRMIRAAAEDPANEHVLVIDEINRGDISRILGPLISAIEPDKRAGAEFPIGFEAQYPRAPGLESRIFLPPNLHIIGTMNSADRNIALVDYALRRRFEFAECPPLEGLLGSTNDADAIDIRALLTSLNRRIRYLLDKDHCIGHGYFMGCDTNADVIERFARRILPLLAEYFYGNESNLLLVLGDRPGGTYNIHLIERPEVAFEGVFGVDVEDALDLGYRAQQARIAISVDPRFWDANRLIPGPRDEAFAVKALQKIYQGGSVSAPSVSVSAAVTSEEPSSDGAQAPPEDGAGVPDSGADETASESAS
jgi:5-methylcytosine-specific restriction protein B